MKCLTSLLVLFGLVLNFLSIANFFSFSEKHKTVAQIVASKTNISIGISDCSKPTENESCNDPCHSGQCHLGHCGHILLDSNQNLSNLYLDVFNDYRNKIHPSPFIEGIKRPPKHA